MNTTRIPFVKMEGCGNDYVFIDAGLTPDAVDVEALGAFDELARAVSDRHYGVGSDGLILLEAGDMSPMRMRMWNADGSEGLLCLNGLRCAAKYAAESVRGLGETFMVETAAGERRVRAHRSALGGVEEVEVWTGEPDFRRESLPASGSGPEIWGDRFPAGSIELPGFAVSVGNPHLVLWAARGDVVRRAALAEFGPRLEKDPRFPRGVNVHVVAATGRDALVMRTWERGSGLTLACGTGAVAAYAVALRLGEVQGEVVARMPGGEVWMRREETGGLVMRGPAREVFRGEWPLG
jgi:diaminopimelate epimerase